MLQINEINQPISHELSLKYVFKKFLHFIFKYGKAKPLLLVFIIITTGLIPAIDSIILQKFTDVIETYSDIEITNELVRSTIVKWVFIYTIWWQSQNIIWRAYDYAYLRIIPNIKIGIIDEMYDHLQFHSHGYFQNNLAGDITNRVTEGSRSLEMIFAYINEKIIRKLAMVIFAIITLFLVHTVIATIFLFWVLIFVTISLYFSQNINYYSTKYGQDKALVAGKVVDSVANISAIRMFTSQKYELHYLRKFLHRSVISDQNMQWFMFKLRFALGLLCTIMVCLIIYHIIILRSNLELSIGQSILIITLCLTVFSDIWDLTQEFGDLFEQVGSFTQSLSLLTAYVVKDTRNAFILTVKEPKIEFKKVTFLFKNNANNFNNQSIIIPPYQKVGLIGFSGSGKTTFTALISRLYDIEDGEILIDGQDIKKVTQDSLRKNISIIPQESVLFHRSIKDNIRYGNHEASDAEIEIAAKSAHIHDFIMGLEHQYETICGERGNNFSGGQRQRIIIARAFLKKAPILILDEATNSLDNHTENLIQSSLTELMKGKTALIIAHRLSTLLNMDRILVFDKGHIIEDGPHSVLRENGELYKILWDNI